MALHQASTGFTDNWFNGFVVASIFVKAVAVVVFDAAFVVFIIIYIVWTGLILYHLMLLPILVMQFSIVPAFSLDEMYRY